MQAKSMIKLGICAGLLAATCVQAATVQEVIASRQANFKGIAKANKGIGDELKKDTPSLETIRANTRTLQQYSTQIPSWFPAGSGAEAGVKTAALPAIWQKPAEFRAAAAANAKGAAELNAAAATGDIARITAAQRSLLGTCKGCHDSFKQKD